MTNLQLEQVIENFYLCSHLPLSAFDNAHNNIFSIGNALKYFPQNMIAAKEAYLQLKDTPFMSYPLENEGIITICPINTKDLEQGVFVIGPYTNDIALKERFPFKPAHCMGALVQLLYAIRESSSLVSSNIKETDYNYHVNRAKEYITKHYDKPITLDTLSDYLGIHKSYLCTIFKQSTKMSFCQYTNFIRIEESKKLLHKGNASILDIALTTGFSSASYFNTTFKKIVGMTPIEYRNQGHTHI